MLHLHRLLLCAMLLSLLSPSLSLRLSPFFASSSALLPRALSLSAARPSANHCSLDVHLLSSNPDLVISHLNSRNADPSIIEQVKKIHDLKQERNSCLHAGDTARNLRKTLSKDIAVLMKAGNVAEVEKLKQRVEEANQQAAKADERQAIIDDSINTILSFIPNLLDDRYVTNF
jgi:hypothetical protein